MNGRYITRHDVDSVLSTAPASIRDEYKTDPDQYKQLVERIANQEAMYGLPDLLTKATEVDADLNAVDRDYALLVRLGSRSEALIEQRSDGTVAVRSIRVA